MTLLSLAKRLGALGFIVSMAVLLSGCSGGGGGKASASQIAHNNGTFSGTVGGTTNFGRATGTSCTIRISGNGGNAAFKSGDYGDPAFLSYSADIVDPVLTPTSEDGNTGTVTFDMTNFTAQSPYASMHWDGTYVWNGQSGTNAAISVTGTITGTDKNGNPISIPFTLDYKFYPNVVNFAGAWTGDIDVPGLGVKTWAGNFTKIDDTHTRVSFTYDDNGTPVTLTVPVVTTNISLSGDFDGSAFVPGATGHLYVERDPAFSDNNHLIGGYTIDLEGTFLASGVIHATKSTGGGGGSGNLLQVGYYQGTLTIDGTTTQQPIKLQITAIGNSPAGAAVEIRGGGTQGGSVAWHLQYLNQGSEGVELFLNAPSQYYQSGAQLQFEGSVSNNVYTGTYNAGGFETGTFTLTKSTAPAAPSSGTYSVTATGGTFGSGTQNAVFTINGNNLTVATTVQGQAITLSGILVGNSFAGHLGATTFGQVSAQGNWEGTFSNTTTFAGSYIFTTTTDQLIDTGTLAGTKTG